MFGLVVRIQGQLWKIDTAPPLVCGDGPKEWGGRTSSLPTDDD